MFSIVKIYIYSLWLKSNKSNRHKGYRLYVLYFQLFYLLISCIELPGFLKRNKHQLLHLRETVQSVLYPWVPIHLLPRHFGNLFRLLLHFIIHLPQLHLVIHPLLPLPPHLLLPQLHFNIHLSLQTILAPLALMMIKVKVCNTLNFMIVSSWWQKYSSTAGEK